MALWPVKNWRILLLEKKGRGSQRFDGCVEEEEEKGEIKLERCPDRGWVRKTYSVLLEFPAVHHSNIWVYLQFQQVRREGRAMPWKPPGMATEWPSEAL